MNEPKLTFENVKGSGMGEATQDALGAALKTFGTALQEIVAGLATEDKVFVVMFRAGGVTSEVIDLDMSLLGLDRAVYEGLSGQ